jgi:uridine phosphorylase
METAGYYALAHILEHEAVSVNAILANRMSNEFAEDPTKVVDDLIELVLEKLVD